MLLKSVLRALCLAALIPGVLLADPGPISPPAIVGICGVIPVRASTCLAVEIPLAADQALTGFRWYNNDGTLTFPQVVIALGAPACVPSMASSIQTLTGVQGPSSGWGEIELAQPIASGADTSVYVFFVLPANHPRTGLGAEGGPGFGLVATSTGVATHISMEGTLWAPTTCKLAFEALEVPIAASAMMASGDEFAAAAPPIKTGFDSVCPNPLNPMTRIRFGVREAARVSLKLYDLRGQRVATLVDANLPMGYHEREWRGLNDQARAVASGVYFARLRIGSQVFTQRLSLVR